jgi:hypothetical protein
MKRVWMRLTHRACPVPAPRKTGPDRGPAIRDFVPLMSFVLPTVAIGYGYVIPKSCIAGLNQLTVGFATTILGACLSYWAGIRAALTRKSGGVDAPPDVHR